MNRRGGCAGRVAIVLGAALLAGCEGGAQDLQGWIARERAAAVSEAAPLPAPGGFEAVAYRGSEGTDPFDPQRLAPPPPPPLPATPVVDSAPAPARGGEPLEAYPLSALRMVGTLSQAGRTVALVQAERLVVAVSEGDHLGEHRGRVTRITETEIALRERVRDARGAWVERPAALRLQETPR